MHRFLLHNDEIRETTDRVVTPGQAGLMNGWGVFSTLRVIDGVLFDCDEHDPDQPRFTTFSQLVCYCEQVASAVGMACIHIWGFNDPAAYEPARLNDARTRDLQSANGQLRRTLEELYEDQRMLAEAVIRHDKATAMQAGPQAVGAWMDANNARVSAVLATIAELEGTGAWTFAKTILAAAEVRGLAGAAAETGA